MAPKDYVARGRAAKKTPAKKQTQQAKPLPWIRLVITLCLVVGFGYFLWVIKDKAADAIPDQTVAKTGTIQPHEFDDNEALPELQDEVYDYPHLFEGMEVVVENKQQTASEKQYLMQCGSFRQDYQAQEMRAKIALQGLEAMVKSSRGNNGLWYRVILGPYDFKRDAEKDRHALRRIKITTCRIWYWNL